MTRTVRFGLFSVGIGVAVLYQSAQVLIWCRRGSACPWQPGQAGQNLCGPVLAIKFAAFWVTGSVALYSDALESIINVVAACAATWALHVSSQPADAGHPYGHGKAEYLSAVLEGVLIILAALSILREAYFGFLSPQPIGAPLLGMAINAVATAINGLWAMVLVRTGRAARSPALVASGKHLFTDVFTSGGVLVGFALVPLTGWLWLDPALAALVAVNILWSGYGLVRDSISGLMDAAPNTETLKRGIDPSWWLFRTLRGSCR